MRLAIFSILLYLLRRVRPRTVAVAGYGMWRRLPPEQRSKFRRAARQHGPRLAWTLLRRRGVRF